jgi:predicted transcriptional regulator
MGTKKIKDCVIGLRCDSETKKSLEDLAESLDMTVSHLIFRLIETNVNIEKQRREKIKQILAEC